MSSINKKSKEKAPKEVKYFYFIPCYDVINKEIYFFDFYTEKIVSKLKKERVKEDTLEFNETITIKNLFSISKTFKKNKDKLRKRLKTRGDLFSLRDTRKINKENYYKKYDKDNKTYNKEISDINENLIKNEETRQKLFQNRKKEILLLEQFALNWKKMKIISGFNENNYMSSRYHEYFSRPLFSKFFIGQNIQLYSFNSTLPLSKAMFNKPYINVYIYYDIENFLNKSNKKVSESNILLNLKNEFQILSDSPRRISLFYIVDTLIKDSIKAFENNIYELLGNFNKENNSEIDSIRNYSSNSDNDDESSEDELNVDDINDKTEDEKKSKFYELLIKIKKNFSKIKENTSNRFVLKVEDSEEYLYGDYTLGSYSFIRSKARQHEGIRLLLKSLPHYKIQPPIFSFPPIIRIKEEDISYEKLFELYVELYPENEIIYRIKKTNTSQIDRYLKKDIKRTYHLIKYTESGDCDFPLKINIKSLMNIDKFKDWLDDEVYNNIQIILPYFNPLKKLSVKKRSTISSFLKSATQCFKKNEEGYVGENMNQKYNLNNESYEDFILKYDQNKKNEREMTENLNNLNFDSYYKSERYNNYIKTFWNYFQILHLFDYEKDMKYYNRLETKRKMGFVSEIPFNENFIPTTKFYPFKLEKHPILFIPIYIRIKIYILYGCFCIKKFATEPFLLKDFILVNEQIVLDGNYCLISHLPYETRIGISIKAYDQKLEKKFVLGSCQIPLYKENGEFQSGEVECELWPNVKNFPRVVISTPFSKIKDKKDSNNKLKLPMMKEFDQVIKSLTECKDSVSPIFSKMLEIEEEENKLNQLLEESKNDLSNSEEEDENDNIDFNFKVNKEMNNINDLNDYKYNYPLITIELPKFSSPLIHTVKNSYSYKHFLEIKYKNEERQVGNDFEEIKALYGNSHQDIKRVIKSMSVNNINKKEYIEYADKEEKINKDIWEYLKITLPSLIKILKKDPLEKLKEEDIKAILICRDYISTIPSALELFLRAINWCNPLEVSVAHTYLKKWTKIDGEDALSLLDARFPDTQVREYAINRLRDFPDDMIDILMLMLCQCLLYETFLINPLADFLIERSLMNPKLIGNSFIWFNRVNMKNPLFEEKLSAYILQLLMISGKSFLSDTFNTIKFNYYLELFTYTSKKESAKNKLRIERKNKNKEKEKNPFLNYFNKAIIGKRKQLPIDPSYICYKLVDNLTILTFDTTQSLLTFRTGKNEDSPERKIVLRIGNDLRQDLLAIQMLRIMDKLWLDNNLDLKLITFKICPTEIFAGYIEFVYFSELYKIQNSSGVIGVLDKEFIIKFLRGTVTDEQSDNDTYDNKIDNFIKSLAGYCVATCVLGVTERSFRNVMIKNNGIFLHINLGHLLGHFKYKCGIKTERSLFLLTPEMANVYICENKEDVFKKCCVKAFNILRHNASKIINPFIIMSAAGLPEFYGIYDINYMKSMLVLDKPNDEDAGNYFVEQIWKCKNEKLRQIDSLIRILKK